jgi:hypothetical protein
MKDNRMLAEAWLSDFQDNDYQPITDDWLESIGFEKHPAMMTLQLQGDELVRYQTGWRLNCIPLKEFEDRGDLRKFLVYLGIIVQS